MKHYLITESIEINQDWSFSNVRSTERWTHGYHRYPAKFLPNIVEKLIEKYTQVDDIVADVFAGCGTTLIEAKVHGRKSIGVDINPVAALITRVKTNPIEPKIVQDAYQILIQSIENYSIDYINDLELHDRIDYWFLPEQKSKIAYLYSEIKKIDDISKEFYLCALSNILKNCSKWLQSSTKPQIDPHKIPQDPFKAFNRQVKNMLKKNEEFYNFLKEKEFLETTCEIKIKDARNTGIENETISAVITSPPYVTSYEYADIHQLTGYWFDYFKNLLDFRKEFIGTFYSQNQDLETKSELGQEIVNELNLKHKKTAKEVAHYFNDMYLVIKEMYRILKPNGHVCVVIGNTTFRDTKIKSVEVFYQTMYLLGFEEVEVIKRCIPNKIIPTIRDKSNGKFTKLTNENSKLVYPEEYILIMKKPYGSN